jgi:hypothetical protein
MNTTKKGVEASGASANTTTSSSSNQLMSVPVTVPAEKKGNGKSYWVWPKKDLLGKPALMAGKDDDRVVNKEEIVKDPETGEDIYLIRIHRGKRVWYGKGTLDVPTETLES